MSSSNRRSQGAPHFARQALTDRVRVSLAGAIVLAALTALVYDSSPARAAFPGVNGKIACGGVRGTQTDIELIQVNPDGSGEQQLTDNTTRDGSPAYSPDGTKIAFEAQRNPVDGRPANTEIYVADNDGDLEGPDVKRLTFNEGLLANGTYSGVAASDFSPSWSPDGTQIVFHSGRVTTFSDGGTSPTNDFEIYKMSADTGETVTPATRLTVNRGQDAIPSWSPDGTKIAFQGFPPGNPSTLGVNLEVFTMNPDGTGRTNVSNNPGTPNDPATTTVNENANGLDRDIIWSPDSQQIAFSSTRGAQTVGYQNFDVWRANRDGSNPVRLTSDPDAPEPAAYTDFDVPLVWSPDGTTILYAANPASAVGATIFSAYKMDAVAGERAPLQEVARVAQFQRCDWARARPSQPAASTTPITPEATPPASPPAPPAAAQALESPFTSKLSLRRSTVDRRDRMLDVFAPITRRASGRVNVQFNAAGTRSNFTAPIGSANGRISFRQRISSAQANVGSGILTMRYPGDGDTRPQTVRLRAAAVPAELRLQRPTIDAAGRLRAEGTISDDARGVVRVQIEYVVGSTTMTRQFTARISDGKWSLDELLEPAVRDEIAQRNGTVHSYTLFTGYQPRRMRGEMRSFQVLGNR